MRVTLLFLQCMVYQSIPISPTAGRELPRGGWTSTCMAYMWVCRKTQECKCLGSPESGLQGQNSSKHRDTYTSSEIR